MINTVIISGRLTADPELKKTRNENIENVKSVTSFTVANETGYGDNKKTNFINCTAWQKTAETICKHCGKGTMVGLEGRIETRSYEDKNGNKKTVTELIVDQFHFMESRKPQTAPQEMTEIDNDDGLPF